MFVDCHWKWQIVLRRKVLDPLRNVREERTRRGENRDLLHFKGDKQFVRNELSKFLLAFAFHAGLPRLILRYRCK